MKCYVITIKDIEKCSKNNIVACWDDKLDKPIVALDAASALLFSENEVIERG